MAQLERDGSCYVRGQYYSSEAARDAAEKHARERDERWSRRRDAWLVRVSREMGLPTDETALARQREAQQVADDDDPLGAPVYCGSDWEREYFARYFSKESDALKATLHTVRCSWCKRVISQGNPDLPESHGLCLTCSAKMDAEDTMRGEDSQC